LVRQNVKHPVSLKPLGSTSFFVAAEDTSGGAGANFMVEWIAEKIVSEPVIEVVMMNTSAGQGISFIVLERLLSTMGEEIDLTRLNKGNFYDESNMWGKSINGRRMSSLARLEML